MHSTDLMYVIAQIAVALAGFSAIIVTLNQKPIREWDVSDQVNIRLLIQLSVVVIFFTLLPPFLAIFMSNSDIWLYALWAYGLIHLADAGFFLFVKSKHTPTIFRVFAACGLAIACLQVSIAWSAGDIAREAVYTFTLIWHLGVIMMAFILLLYQVRGTKNKDNNSGESK